MGSPQYMSPEQLLGLPVDGRSDLFACGVILYQFLTGTKPFKGSVATVMQQVLNVDPTPPSQVNPGLPRVWDALLRRAMARAPEARFQTAGEMAAAIRATAAEALADDDATVLQAVAPTVAPLAGSKPARDATAPPALPAAAAPTARRPVGAAAAVLVAGAAAAGGWFWLKPVPEPTPPSREAAAAASAPTASRPGVALAPAPASDASSMPTAAVSSVPTTLPSTVPASASKPASTSTVAKLAAGPPAPPPSPSSAARREPPAVAVTKQPPAPVAPPPAAPSPTTRPPAVPSPAPAPAASPAPAPTPSPMTAAIDWHQRAAQVEASPSAATLGTALAMLLDLRSRDDRRTAADIEVRIPYVPPHHAIAMGLRDGALVFVWPASAGPPPGGQGALQRCQAIPAQVCRLVYARGEFRRSAFFEVASHLGEQRPADARSRSIAAMEQLLGGLRALPAPSAQASGPGAPSPGTSAAAARPVPAPAPAATPAPGGAAAEWDAARSAVRALPHGASFSATMGALLAARSADETDTLTRFEASMKRLPWKSALAMGTHNGTISYGLASRDSRVEWADEAALKACLRYNGAPCVVVMRNGTLLESGLLPVADKLGPVPQATVRQQLLRAMRKTVDSLP
jgi:hypothetical protein